ncbi:hypothetical protein F4604DRAFT_1686505 [Suillus subluteus]|nr:hypothetical protein F4604DRAFT_1686505 [Suillus subluteus]
MWEGPDMGSNLFLSVNGKFPHPMDSRYYALLELMYSGFAIIKDCNTSQSQYTTAPAKKARQPSVKPMRIGTKVTPHNLCGLDWQANGHQCELASAFTLCTLLEQSVYQYQGVQQEYKQKATAQVSSSSTLQGKDSENEYHD